MNTTPSNREGRISDVYDCEDGRVLVHTETPEGFPDIKTLDQIRIRTDAGDDIIVQVLGIELRSSSGYPPMLGHHKGGYMLRWIDVPIKIDRLEGARFSRIPDE